MKIILLFSLFLLLFMGLIALFDTIHESHCTILTNFIYSISVIIFQFLQNKRYSNIPSSWIWFTSIPSLATIAGFSLLILQFFCLWLMLVYVCIKGFFSCPNLSLYIAKISFFFFFSQANSVVNLWRKLLGLLSTRVLRI